MLACSCNGSGVCSIHVKGTADYFGPASFDYTVTTNAQVSNSATASITIESVDDSPWALDPVISDGLEDTVKVITLGYTDVESDKADACSIAGITNSSITTPCACDGSGVCTVSVKGDPNYIGTAAFWFFVRANGAWSNSGFASFNIINVDDSPIADNISPPNGTENIESFVTLSYTDVDSDRATSCAVTTLNDLTVSTPCACDGGGLCTVGVTGTTNHSVYTVRILGWPLPQKLPLLS